MLVNKKFPLLEPLEDLGNPVTFSQGRMNSLIVIAPKRVSRINQLFKEKLFITGPMSLVGIVVAMDIKRQ